MASLPASRASSRRSLANHCLILALARGDTTKVCQSREGPALAALEVKTSTTSPFSSLRSSATSRPLTRAPIQRCPTSVCTAYAKSTGVEPAGSVMTSPLGVKTKISWTARS
ncbi:Uncharacterised protein [Mycobacteroides abscessus subsp. abscessus]|nr:Uncharacterised protein [Mycobacteroides abscessus subsp. abscessus]